ncbi:MAG: hypothetical protein ACOC1K_00665 [Nanoarchaeota archaeon]
MGFVIEKLVNKKKFKRGGLKTYEDLHLKEIKPAVHGGKPQKVLYEGDNFTTRIIKLDVNGKIPDCKMSFSVIFNVISGSVGVKVNRKTSKLKKDI